MNILLCCHLPLEASFGGAKVYIENAKSYEMLGANVLLVGLSEVFPEGMSFSLEERINLYPNYLLKYLEKIKDSFDFDVIEYESLYFPIKRPDYLKDKIFVARSVLLEHHFLEKEMPYFKNFRSIVGRILKGTKRRKDLLARININNTSMKLADYINVPNSDDKLALIKHGHESDKIIVSPYGIYNDRLEELKKTKTYSKDQMIISFVGTFDPRKGAVEFPNIIKLIKKHHPQVIFRLIGTSALFPNEESIYDYFPDELRENLEVIPKFKPSELATLLEGSRLGVFPSHMESFGFGVLEMVAANIPVLAYDVPGPNKLLPKEFLVPAGDYERLAEKILEHLLLSFEESFRPLENIVNNFKWPDINQKTLDFYEEKVRSK